MYQTISGLNPDRQEKFTFLKIKLNKAFIILTTIVIFLSNSDAQDKGYYFLFKVSDFPAYLKNKPDHIGEKAYYTVSLKNDSKFLKLRENKPFNGEFYLFYSDDFADSSININFIRIKGNCIDSMVIILKPQIMKTNFGKIENIKFAELAFGPGVFNIQFPENKSEWDKLKQIPVDIDILKSKKKGLLFTDITEYQSWIPLLFENRDKVTESNIYFDFRIVDINNNSINKKNKDYSVKLVMVEPIFDRAISFNSFNLIDTCGIWETINLRRSNDDSYLEIWVDKKDSKKQMRIKFDPVRLFFSCCSYPNIFVDSIKFKNGDYEIIFPENINSWANYPKINLNCNKNEFYDITKLQTGERLK